jgi:hypothetical protein
VPAPRFTGVLALLLFVVAQHAAPVPGFACNLLFCTPIHNFAQPSAPILIDAKNLCDYRARQIEPGSLKLYGSA